MNEGYNIQLLIDYAQTLKGADVYYRDDWQCYYFSLLGKCFGMLSSKRITLKGDPVENSILRETYSSVTPGYYANKKHWNSIDLLFRSFDDEQMKCFIMKSYELVFQGLTRKEKEIIQELNDHE